MSTKEKKQKDLNVVEDDIEEIKEPSTITNMVKELKELDNRHIDQAFTVPFFPSQF